MPHESPDRPAPAPPRPDPEPRAAQIRRVELGLSLVLRAGVILSALLVLTGIILMFIHHPAYFTDAASAQSIFHDMAFPHTIREVLHGILQGEGRAIVIVGLFVLIATPVARVAASVLVFLHLRDRMFTAFTVLVLALLLTSFLLGRAGG